MRLLHHCARTMSAFMAAASLVALIGTPCSADVPPPPPPPSPPPGLGTSGGRQAARDLRTGTAPSNRILLTLGNEDTVVVDPTVQLSGVGNVVEIPAPASALRYALASGDTLRVDGSTPPGAYELADGRRVTLGAALGYPRIYTISPKPHYALSFSTSSRRRIGVLVASSLTLAFTARDDGSLAETFGSMCQYRSSRVRNSEPLAFAVPRDWYRHAWVELPDTLADYRVLFFGYGASGPAPSVTPVTRSGRVRFNITARPSAPAVELPGASPLQFIGELRLTRIASGTLRVEKVR